MYLCIDIGNTRTKASVFGADGVILHSTLITEHSVEELNELIKSYHVAHVITSATGKKEWNNSSLNVPGVNIELSHTTPLPIRIIYSTPETLGRDRIAAACGAHFLFTEKNLLIVDAGTCITMDILLKNGTYLGGNIAPGVSMRLRAMHDYTAKLPLVEKAWPSLPFGDSTVNALQNGACLGAVMEINGILHQAKNAFGAVFIVITGGDAPFLVEKLESEIFVEPELVVKGLFKILSFNVQNDY